MMSETEHGANETELETPIKVRWTGYTRERIYGYNLDFQTEKSDRVVRAMNRQKTNVVIKTVEEARAMVAELTNYYGNEYQSRVWMNASAGSAVDRVRQAVIDEMSERGFAVEDRHSVSVEFREGSDPEDSEEDTMTRAEKFASEVREVIGEHGKADVFDGMNTHTLTDADEIQVSDGFISVDGAAFKVTDQTQVTPHSQDDSEDSEGGEDDDGIGPLFTDGGADLADGDSEFPTTALNCGNNSGIPNTTAGADDHQKRMVGSVFAGQVLVDAETYEYDRDLTNYENYAGNRWVIASISEDSRWMTLRKLDGEDEGRERRLTVAAFAREAINGERWMILKDDLLANTWSEHMRGDPSTRCQNCGVTRDNALSREEHFTTEAGGREWEATLRRCTGCDSFGVSAIAKDKRHSGLNHFTTGILEGPDAPWNWD